MPKHKSRGNGTGSAYYRADRHCWEASVVVGWKPPAVEGARPVPVKRRRSGFKTKKAALEYCPVLLAGGVVRPEKAPRLSAYWDTYLQNEYTRLSGSKQTAYRIAWKKLSSLHDRYVDTITVDALRTTVSSACPTYYPAKDCKNLLSNLFSLAAADGYASKDLPSFIILPPLEEKEHDVFTDTEQAALWKTYESGNKDAAIPLLMIYTGMMPGEAQKLRVEHIDLESRTITHAGIKTKVRKATPVVIAGSILPVVEDLIASAQPSGYIWKQNEEEWYARYYAALEAAGCRRLTPYTCRHTTATALAINERVAPQTIRKVMRWSTTRMLDRYAHPTTDDALAAVDSLHKSS